MDHFSRHGIKTRPSHAEVWVTTMGDAGMCFYGHARIGIHELKTGDWYPTITGAEVAAYGLLAAHVACVGVRHEKSDYGAPSLASLGIAHADDCPCAQCAHERQLRKSTAKKLGKKKSATRKSRAGRAA